MSSVDTLSSPALASSSTPAPVAAATSIIPNLDALYDRAEAARIGLTPSEFADALLAAANRTHCNKPSDAKITAADCEAFYNAIHLADLALAYACALGHDAAWQTFLSRFREPLAQAAIAITGSVSLGRDLADALPSELFGLTTREGERRSPLLTYTGRGSLLGWLRSTLAQRHVDRHRRTHRETPLETLDVPAAQAEPTPSVQTAAHLQTALTAVLRSLQPEDAFVLSSWFLDGRTLLQIAKLLRVSEATVSRRVKRLTGNLRSQLLTTLTAQGLSRRAADEALGIDPRDLSLNLRALLQSRAQSAFQEERLPETPHP